MVKVLENRIVDLDILPGTKEEQEAAAKQRQTAAGGLPTADAQNSTPGRNAQNAGMAVGGALGGAVKGVVDTAGNTIGTLGEGLAGTLGGVGQGLGGAAVYGGGALDGAARSLGGALGFGGQGGRQTQEVEEHLEEANKK